MAIRIIPSNEPGQQMVEAPDGVEKVDVLADGPTLVQLMGGRIAKSKNGGDQYLCFAVGTKGDIKGKGCIISFSLLDKSLWVLKEAMRKAGVIDDIEENVAFEIDDEEIVNRFENQKVIANFFIDEYEGKESSKLARPAFLTKEEAKEVKEKAKAKKDDDDLDF